MKKNFMSVLVLVSLTAVCSVSGAAEWSDNLVSATQWNTDHDSYTGENGSAVSLSNEDSLQHAEFQIGVGDADNEIYPWANISAMLDGTLQGVDAVRIRYRADAIVGLTLDQEGLMDAGASYGAALPATDGQWYDTIVEVPAGFSQPEWVATSTPLALDEVKRLSFTPAVTGAEASLDVADLSLRNYAGGYVGLISQGTEALENSPAVSLHDGALSVRTLHSGSYSLHMYGVGGRRVFTLERMLGGGINRIGLPDGISRGVYFIRIQGAEAGLTQKIVVE